MTWLQDLLEGMLVMWMCRQGMQCCHWCHDERCCDNTRGRY